MSESGYAGAKQLRRLLDAVVGIGGDLSLDVVLHRITETAVELVSARYGALGVLDAEGTSLVEFITVGFTEEQRIRIGELPKGHGILGLLIVDPQPLRLPDLNEHPDSFGFPPGHPPMTSFLGVPIYVHGQVYGNLYLTDKAQGEAFTDVDAELAVGLATAAGVAIDNARLHDRVRELDVLSDRERIARDLHDTVIQRLFATGLSLQGAARLAERPEVRVRIQQAVDDIDETVRQVRSAIFELHTQDSAEHGLRRQLLDVGTEMAQALGYDPMIRFDGPIDSLVGDNTAEQVLAVAREALANTARHAGASRVELTVTAARGLLTLVVLDDGAGPGAATGGRGVGNMRQRAEALGGKFTIGSRAVGGTELRWSVPLGD